MDDRNFLPFAGDPALVALYSHAVSTGDRFYVTGQFSSWGSNLKKEIVRRMSIPAIAVRL